MVSEVRIDSEEHPRGGHVATVCHDNAEKLNVMDRSGADALNAAIERAGGSRDVRVIVLRGAGERAFIGGADIRAMVDLTPESSRPFITLICVPGGAGMNALLNDEETLDFVRRQASGARCVTSVCTGSLVLGAAGLLQGKRATTHWMSLPIKRVRTTEDRPDPDLLEIRYERFVAAEG